jgi:hypothetical protein
MTSHGVWAGRLRSVARDAGPTDEAIADDGALECSLDELREFLEADLADIPVDLEFKESLRKRLWELVRARNRMQRGSAKGD